jgi:hypothetical protein
MPRDFLFVGCERGHDWHSEFVHEHRALIAAIESCQRSESPSYSWHVVEWMAWKLRTKYPLVMNRDRIVSFHQAF